jgi:hypothetical protein
MWELVVKVNQSTTGRMNDFSKKQDHSSDRFSDFIFSQLRSRNSPPEKTRVVVSLSKTTLLCWTTYTLTVRILQFVLFYYFLTKKCSLFVI